LVGTASREDARAADHGDTPALVNANRKDALLTDLHTFVRSGRLVLSVCTNTAIPVDATSYLFPSDLTVKIMIDRDCPVAFDDAGDLAMYGGTILTPASILEDIVFQVTFPDGVNPVLAIEGLSLAAQSRVRLFTGLRDDPFIRGPRQGRNVAAIVIDLPLADVMASQPTLLIWATSRIPELSGPFQDLAGRALRNMFPENDAMNGMHPNQHMSVMSVPPDVVIYNTSLPAEFPNGRELADDVVDMVGDSRVTTTDAPFPTANDRPFLAGFPYLAFGHGLDPPPIPALSGWGIAALATLIVAIGSVLVMYTNRRRSVA
jgi:hypothetical protein